MSQTQSASRSKLRRGPVLEVLRDLLAKGERDAVLELVSKLVDRNSELERKLAEVRSPRRANEGVSAEQLMLLLEGLASSGDEQRDEADRKLRAVAEQAAPEPR